MIRKARVAEIIDSWQGCQCLALEVCQAPPSANHFLPGEQIRAVSYEQNVGLLITGDVVQVDVSALAKSLGTGGWGIILANESRLAADRLPANGHLVKARYTPTQTVVQGVDEQDSPHHKVLSRATSVSGMITVVADLHSALPAILTGLRLECTSATVAYIYSDGGALPVAYSRQVARLRELGWLTSVISCGQAYGGDLEAVNVHSALLAARHVVGAQVALIIQGPGNLGTDTRWGFSGISCGEHLNAIGHLGGTPLGVLRMSQADCRERHLGISHHSMTAYTLVAQAGVHLAVPDVLNTTDIATAGTVSSSFPRHIDPKLLEKISSQLAVLRKHRHQIHYLPVAPLATALQAAPVTLSTMGRDFTQDPLNFLAAGAAGQLAGKLLQAESKPK